MDRLQEIFSQILSMDITGSMAILLVLGIRLLLQKAPKRYSYFLWGIVWFRLICPVTFSSIFSVLNVLDLSGVTNGETAQSFQTGQMSGGAQEPVGQAYKEIPMAGLTKELEPMPNDAFFRQPETFWSVIWLAGVVILAIAGIVSTVKLQRKLACSMKLRDNIYLADYIETPFVFGLLKPRIYLPSPLPLREREFVILHEQCHINRKDNLIRAAAYVTLCAHWFSPLVWLSFLLSGKDMEMSCDEAVMRNMEGDMREEYAKTLLRLSTGKWRIAGAPLAFGEGSLKGRIQNIMNYKKQKAFVGAAAGLICIIGAVCLATNPTPEKSKPEKEAEAVVRIQEEEPPLTGTEAAETETALHNVFDADLIKAAQKAVFEHNADGYGMEYDIACCDFAKLETDYGKEDAKNGVQTVTAYGWAYYAQYAFSTYGIKDVGSSHVPVALTFTLDQEGYHLKEYWEPRDGSYFASDVKRKFPASVAADGLDSQKFVLGQTQACYKQAVESGELDADFIIENLLNQICESLPEESSNPQDYIRAHDGEYMELRNYGEFTIQYCLDRFYQGEPEEKSGLKGHIMALICEELLGIKGIIPVQAKTASTGQEWFEALAAHAGNILDQYIKLEKEPVITEIGIPVELPPNTSWIQNRKVMQSDENQIQIRYYDAIFGGECTLWAVKDGHIPFPRFAEEKEADETWQGTAKQGQTVYVKLYCLEEQVIAVWEYKEYSFAIFGNAAEPQSDSSPIPKAALYVIQNLE